MSCSRCGNAAHLDFADGSERCTPCHRVPAFCRCIPSKAERVPAWIARRNEGRLPAKELVA